MDPREETLDAPLLDHSQGLPVDAGSSPVAANTLPGLQQDVTPPDPVEQCMEAPTRVALGRDEKLALEFSYFGYGVVGRHRHALALTSTHKRDRSRAPSLLRGSPAASAVL